VSRRPQEQQQSEEVRTGADLRDAQDIRRIGERVADEAITRSYGHGATPEPRREG
jgi:hypothetical protein